MHRPTLILLALASATTAFRLRYLPFKEARLATQRQGLRSMPEYEEWRSTSRRFFKNAGFLMPEQPDLHYAEHWEGWDDWLGGPLSYEEAVTVTHSLGIRSQEHWWAFTRDHADELVYYGLKKWRGYDEWLGLETEPLVFPSSWGKSSDD